MSLAAHKPTIHANSGHKQQESTHGTRPGKCVEGQEPPQLEIGQSEGRGQLAEDQAWREDPEDNLAQRVAPPCVQDALAARKGLG